MGRRIAAIAAGGEDPGVIRLRTEGPGSGRKVRPCGVAGDPPGGSVPVEPGIIMPAACPSYAPDLSGRPGAPSPELLSLAQRTNRQDRTGYPLPVPIQKYGLALLRRIQECTQLAWRYGSLPGSGGGRAVNIRLAVRER